MITKDQKESAIEQAKKSNKWGASGYSLAIYIISEQKVKTRFVKQFSFAADYVMEETELSKYYKNS